MRKSWLILSVTFVALFVVLSSIVTARESGVETADSVYLPIIRSNFDLDVVPFAEGLPHPAEPTDMTDPGDGRLFVTMIDGRVLIIDQVGNIWPNPLLDIRDIVDDIGFEKGLLGLAAHPNFLMNGYIYVFFNSTIDDQLFSKLSRFTVVNDVAAPESELVMLQLAQQEDVHQGGALRFGPNDGYLYVGIGDDSRAPDNGLEAHAQSGATMLGKILRLDVNSALPYAIPPDNPFVNDPQVLDEIWALGLRNPWRINFDRLTGDLYIGDVGSNRWEEIDFQQAASNGGENYGWPCFEGPDPFATLGCRSATEYVAPYFYYAHALDTYHCSIIGGTVYRGSLMPELVGHYLFTDYCAGTLYSLYTNQEGELTLRSWREYDHLWHTFAERSDGELFMGAANTDTIYQLTPLGYSE